MKIVSIIFIICFIRYAHLKPVSEANPFWIIFPDPECVKEVKEITTIAYNKQHLQGNKNVKATDTCKYIGKDKKVAFLVHGFMSNPETTKFLKLASQLVKKDYTVFSVDWTKGACTRSIPIYPSAAKNTRTVGHLAAKYVEHITKNCQVPLKNIILIGHSLGAHVSGFIAKKVKEMGLGTISRLFGADPAGPWFSSNKCEDRLCDTDATRVTVLHTSTLYGINKPIGHLNLYFNDASSQPGCGWDLISTCAHSNAIIYLTVLLEHDNCGFPGVSKLDKFDQSKRPTEKSTNCIFVDKKIFEHDNISPGAYTVFVNDPPTCLEQTFCSENKFRKCQQ